MVLPTEPTTTHSIECRIFSFYYRHSDLIVKYNIGPTRHNRTCILGDLVYKVKRIVGNPSFCDQFEKIIKRYKRFVINLKR